MTVSSAFENRPLAASLSMLSAMAIIGFIDNFVARISDSMGLWQFVAMRAAMMTPLLILMSWAGLGRLKPQLWWPVLARALMLSMAMFLYFGALGLMPISEALAGLFTSPIFVLLINATLQGKRIGPWRILAVLLGFVGILLVLQPGVDGLSLVTLMPVAAGLCYAISSIATRSWCAGESALSLLASNMIMLGGLAALSLIGLSVWGPEETSYLTRGWNWPVADSMPWLLLQAVGSLGGVFLIIRAYQMDEPSNVAVFEYSIMVYAPVFAFLLFGQSLDALRTVGIAMIACAGVIIALRSK